MRAKVGDKMTFRGCQWDDGWEYDAPCVLYSPIKRCEIAGNAYRIIAMIESVCYDLCRMDVNRGWEESDLHEFHWRGWGKTGFAARKTPGMSRLRLNSSSLAGTTNTQRKASYHSAFPPRSRGGARTDETAQNQWRTKPMTDAKRDALRDLQDRWLTVGTVQAQIRNYGLDHCIGGVGTPTFRLVQDYVLPEWEVFFHGFFEE